MTYVDNLLDEVGHAAVGENLPLGGFVVEQDVEGPVLVGLGSLVETTAEKRVGTID